VGAYPFSAETSVLAKPECLRKKKTFGNTELHNCGPRKLSQFSLSVTRSVIRFSVSGNVKKTYSFPESFRPDGSLTEPTI